jgi:hypothetical protein
MWVIHCQKFYSKPESAKRRFSPLEQQEKPIPKKTNNETLAPRYKSIAPIGVAAVDIREGWGLRWRRSHNYAQEGLGYGEKLEKPPILKIFQAKTRFLIEKISRFYACNLFGHPGHWSSSNSFLE